MYGFAITIISVIKLYLDRRQTTLWQKCMRTWFNPIKTNRISRTYVPTHTKKQHKDGAEWLFIGFFRNAHSGMLDWCYIFGAQSACTHLYEVTAPSPALRSGKYAGVQYVSPKWAHTNYNQIVYQRPLFWQCVECQCCVNIANTVKSVIAVRAPWGSPSLTFVCNQSTSVFRLYTRSLYSTEDPHSGARLWFAVDYFIKRSQRSNRTNRFGVFTCPACCACCRHKHAMAAGYVSWREPMESSLCISKWSILRAIIVRSASFVCVTFNKL